MNSTFKKIQCLLLVIVFSAVLIPGLASAADSPTSGQSNTTPVSGPTSGQSNSTPGKIVPLQNPLKVSSIGGLIQSFVEIFSYIVILGAVLALIWVGLQFITARGNAEKMKELKSWLSWIVIGVAVVIGARLIIQVVINTLSASGVVDQKTIQSAQKAVSGN